MTYTEYKSARQGEFNALPIFWAFSNKQFEEAMQERGLTADDTDKIFSLGAGGFALKSDKDVILAFLKKEDPLPELMKDTAFAVDAFCYEMQNHEYGINWQGDWDVCSCFGECEYANDKNGPDYLREMGYDETVVSAYSMARKRYRKMAEENEWFRKERRSNENRPVVSGRRNCRICRLFLLPGRLHLSRKPVQR